VSRTADIARSWAPALLVTVLGLAVIWPVPLGRMPLSADHTVHLTRIWLFADTLAQGSVRSWSPVWFFGTPVGDLYPVLGDLIVIAVRVVSFGLLDWPRAYAIGFTIVFVAQGWVMLRAGRTMGLGPWPGIVAAALTLLDVGWYREGGFMYTVFYGVWPQTLATSLAWLGLAELTAACDSDDAKARRRRIALAGLSMGGALLAHQMSMIVLAIAGPIVVLTVGIGSRDRLRRSTITGSIIGVLGFAVAAWWVVPMLAHRGWMASYGWLHRPLAQMIEGALEGRWCIAMPPAVGWIVLAGMIVVAIKGSRAARAFAAVAIVLWVMASIDVVWELRLDLVSDGFAHLQYQRFITAAKPGLHLVAGAVIGMLVQLVIDRRAQLPIAIASGLVAVVLCVWMLVGQRAEWTKQEIPQQMVSVQLDRAPDLPGLDEDHAALARWLGEQWSARDRFWRTTVRDQRNIHWFMDVPALADGVPLLKQGFTPGDNFVHKPEQAPPQLQALAQVRYEIRRGKRGGRGLVQRFGQIEVFERAGWEQDGIATMRGSGRVEVLEDTGETVRVRVSEAGDDAMLVFGIAGYPRWRLDGPDGDIEWLEVPVVGDGPSATQAQRRGAELRGGKAHGDDGSEPTLLAASVRDGEYTLHYDRWRARDVVALLLSLVALAACIALLLRKLAQPDAALDTLHRRLRPIGHPLVWAAAVLALALLGTVRVHRGRSAEETHAMGWALDQRAELRSAHVAFHKTDMLIRPAIVFDRKPRDAGLAAFPNVPLGDTLEGWIALDDDDAKDPRRGTQHVTIEARPQGSEAWTPILDRKLSHEPGRTLLSLPLGALAHQVADVRVIVRSEGQRPPLVAFDLDLGAAPS
jgi:hypothetical protein